KRVHKTHAERTTARTCEEQRKTDYCRAVLVGWEDCFSPTTPKLTPKAPADRTTARTCHEQKKPDYCRAFLSGWQDCFSPTTPKLNPKLLRIEPRLEPATNKKSPTTVELFCRGGRIRTYDLHIPNVARYRATLHPD